MVERVFAMLLRVWPEAVRRRVGDELLETFRARLRERAKRPWGGAWFLVRELAGVALAGLVARRALREPVPVTRRGPMDAWLQDVRFALRALGRNPGFTAIVVLVLALGIGANTAIFSVLNVALLRPLPAVQPERLVTIRESNPEKGWEKEVAAPANMYDWREGVEAFEDVAAHTGGLFGTATLTGDGEPEIIRRVTVTGNVFALLGARPQLGRTFREEETWSTEPRTAVLSDGFWTRRFGRDPDVLGRTIVLNGVSYEVVGIMPASFDFPAHDLDVWTTMGWDPASRDAAFFRRAHWIDVIARLEPGVTLTEADAQLQLVVRRLQEEYPETNRAMGAVMFPLQEFLTGDVRTPLLLLQAAVLLLLLVACANVGNLMLVRASARRRELAVRAALGAGRGRLARLVLTESLALAFWGGLVGVGLGLVTVRMLAGIMPPGLPPMDGFALDGRVAAFAAALTQLAGAAFGMIPALRLGRGLSDPLREGGRGGTAGRTTLRAGNLFVAAEVAVALILVLGAGLLVRSFAALRDVDPGFRTENRVTARVAPPGSRYDTADKVNIFFDALRERLAALPGVDGVGLVRALPLMARSFTSDFVVDGWAPDRFGVEVTNQSVSPDYFATMGIPLLSGRPLAETDRDDSEPVLLVNQALVRRYFAGEDPVGRRIAFTRTPTEESTWWRIVGVVGDVHQESLGQPPIIEVYRPYRQDASLGMAVVVASSRPFGDVVAALRGAVRELDADIPLADVRSLEDIYASSLRAERFLLTLMAGFAAIAMVLAALGIYGVASQAAKRRTQEIGIRVALGARRADVARLILRNALGPVGAGVVLGVAGGLAATRVMASVLFQTRPNDVVTFITVPVVLGLVALAATWLPARGATRVDPVTALRAE